MSNLKIEISAHRTPIDVFEVFFDAALGEVVSQCVEAYITRHHRVMTGRIVLASVSDIDTGSKYTYIVTLVYTEHDGVQIQCVETMAQNSLRLKKEAEEKREKYKKNLKDAEHLEKLRDAARECALAGVSLFDIRSTVNKVITE